MFTVRARRLVLLLAALTAVVLAGCSGVTTTSGSTGAGVQNRLWALNVAAPTIVGLATSESSCSRPGFSISPAGMASWFCVAAEGGAAGGGDLLALGRGEPELTQNALEHIVYRHFPASDAANAGKFAEGTTGQDVKSMIQDAVQNGSFRPNTGGRPGTIYEYDFGQTIGVSRAGSATSNLRVVVGPNGQVITAFPY